MSFNINQRVTWVGIVGSFDGFMAMSILFTRVRLITPI